MSSGTRREPEGIYGNDEEVNVRRSSLGTTESREWLNTNLGNRHTSDDEGSGPSQLLQTLSLSDVDEDAAEVRASSPQDWSCSRDVPICLHPQQPGSPGAGPVLITLPLQGDDTLQAFVPCTVCHLPNLATPGPRASDTVAFCVSEINIRSSQLVLVPCYTCWRSRPVTGMPEQIKVPLFHSILNGNLSENRSEDSLRFVPCLVCLDVEHSTQVERLSQPVYLESRSQQTTNSQGIGVSQPEDTLDDDLPRYLLEAPIGKAAVTWFVPFSNRISVDESLQMAFLLHCGQVVKHVRQRQRELPVKAFGRLQNTKPKQKPPTTSSQMNWLNTAVPLPTGYHHFSHSQMRQQTERIYKDLAEVKEQQIQQSRQQLRNTHRLTAYVFQKHLQRAVLRGKVSWRISESCI